MGGGFRGDGGPCFFGASSLLTSSASGIRRGHGFGAVCVNDADHHRHLQLAGVFNGLTDELMQLVKGNDPARALGASGAGDLLAAR